MLNHIIKLQKFKSINDANKIMALRQIIFDVINDIDDMNKRRLQSLKNYYCKEFSVSSFCNYELLDIYRKMLKNNEVLMDERIWNLLRTRGVRSKAGIVNVTLLTKAYPCPGRCVFCPTEPNMPKSYLSTEPAMMRAVLNNFSAFRQVKNRLESLNAIGHHTDKVDAVIAGGTFSFYPKGYQRKFILQMFNALNSPVKSVSSLKIAQTINENAINRCIGLSVETRPDHISANELRRLRRYGCTKIEIGVQSLNDSVLDLCKRGHNTKQTAEAFKLIKDAGFKLNAHIMPNLPGSTPHNDLNDIKMLFENDSFRPDWLKVYPCVVVPWSELKSMYEKGLYKSYDDVTLLNLMIEMNKFFPEYVRVTRIYRDIPSSLILSGSKLANMRQLIEKELVARGIPPREIRYREIKDQKVSFDQLNFKCLEYSASGGREFFLSYNYVPQDKLCSLLRLRFTSQSMNCKKHFISELNGAALIREVHVYGESVKLDSSKKGASQHIGLGKRMIDEAEKISKKAGFTKIAVISGIGVREYYKKLGYVLEGTYMVKYL